MTPSTTKVSDLRLEVWRNGLLVLRHGINNTFLSEPALNQLVTHLLMQQNFTSDMDAINKYIRSLSNGLLIQILNYGLSIYKASTRAEVTIKEAEDGKLWVKSLKFTR